MLATFFAQRSVTLCKSGVPPCIPTHASRREMRTRADRKLGWIPSSGSSGSSRGSTGHWHDSSLSTILTYSHTTGTLSWYIVFHITLHHQPEPICIDCKFEVHICTNCAWNILFFIVATLNWMPIRLARAPSWKSDKMPACAVQSHKTAGQDSCSLVVALPFSFHSGWRSRIKLKAKSTILLCIVRTHRGDEIKANEINFSIALLTDRRSLGRKISRTQRLSRIKERERHTWYLSFFLHAHISSHENFTLGKCENLRQNCQKQ